VSVVVCSVFIYVVSVVVGGVVGVVVVIADGVGCVGCDVGGVDIVVVITCCYVDVADGCCGVVSRVVIDVLIVNIGCCIGGCGDKQVTCRNC